MRPDFPPEPPLERRRRVYLVRHGDVSYFDASGRPLPPDAVPLNAEGRRQAEALARLLAPLAIDRAVSSGLPRTRQTAEILLRARPAPIALEDLPELAEIRPGPLRAIPAAGLRRAFLEALPRAPDPEARFLGGERYVDFFARVLPAWGRLLADSSWRGLLIVAHGGVNRALLLSALGLLVPGGDRDWRGFGALEQDPAALNILDVDGDGRGILRLLNHTPYDEAKAELTLTTMERLWRQFRGER